MYRSARGAFESLNPDMLDAARTLGWNEGRIFFKLMLLLPGLLLLQAPCWHLRVLLVNLAQRFSWREIM